MGLPSGLLWAKYNVGSTSTSQVNKYFEYGNPIGYTSNQIGTTTGKKRFSSTFSDYKFGIKPNFSKYNDIDKKLFLDPEDDAAHVNMGGDWRMPIVNELTELIKNTNIEVGLTDGSKIIKTGHDSSRVSWSSNKKTIKYIRFINRKDETQYIELSMLGVAQDGKVAYPTEYTYIPSSEIRIIGETTIASTTALTVDTTGVFVDANLSRSQGFPVRGVIGGNN